MNCRNCNVAMIQPINYTNIELRGPEIHQQYNSVNLLPSCVATPFVCPNCGLVEFYVIDKNELDVFSKSMDQ